MLPTGDLTTAAVRQPEQSTPRVLSILSHVLEKLVARNDMLALEWNNNGGKNRGLNVFHGVRAPSISILSYLERLYKYTECSPSCFVVGYVYIDRLIHKHPDSLLVSLNVHRLLLTCVLVASKMLDDVAPEQCILRKGRRSEQCRAEQA
ncbi:CYCU1-1 [Linum perenne]